MPLLGLRRGSKEMIIVKILPWFLLLASAKASSNATSAKATWLPSGTYTTTYQATWNLGFSSLLLEICDIVSLPTLRLRCNGGQATFLEKAANNENTNSMECTSIGANEIECRETNLASRYYVHQSVYSSNVIRRNWGAVTYVSLVKN